MIKLLISCRSHLFAEGLQSLLNGSEYIYVLGIACTKPELEEMFALDPDILLVDSFSWNLLTEEFEKAKNKKILFISDGHDMSTGYFNLQKMVANGLAGMVTNKENSKMLEKAILKINSGDLWFDHNTIKRSLSHSGYRKNIGLTKKESEVLGHICKGLTNKEVAQKLSISEQTVKSHCNKLFKKFGVQNRLKLVLSAQDYAENEVI